MLGSPINVMPKLEGDRIIKEPGAATTSQASMPPRERGLDIRTCTYERRVEVNQHVLTPRDDRGNVWA